MKTNLLKAINDVVNDDLSVMEQGALCRMLEDCRKKDQPENGRDLARLEYVGAIDYLWMAFRIDGDQRDLLEELPDDPEL